jgi:hypothetical protein
MNKKGVVISLLLISLIFTISFGNSASYISDDTLRVGVLIEEPTLKITILEDYIYLGNLTKGDVTKPKPFNVTNTGTIDAIIQPMISSNDIFSNLYVGNSSTQGYEKIGEYTGKIASGHREDFWLKLDLRNYTGTITGNLSAEITFLVMSDE